DRAGTMTIFAPKYGLWNCDGMAATDRKAATEWLSDPGRMLLFDPTKLSVHEHPIDCRTLDSYKLKPVLIKVHAQGSELSILGGSKQTIKQHQPAIMCAFPSTAITELLADWGYRPHVYFNQRFAPGVAKQPVTFTWYLTQHQVCQLALKT